MIIMNQKKEIPQGIAIEICEKIRDRNKQKHFIFSIGKMQCHFCWYFGKKEYEAGNPEKMCAFGSDDNRGCWQINRIYDQQLSHKV
jgi:hypothetical protein